MLDPEALRTRAVQIVREKGLHAYLTVNADNKKEVPNWYAHWRDSNRHDVKLKVGPARVKRRPRERNPFVDDDPGRPTEHEPRNQAAWRRNWEEVRKGPGMLSVDAASREAGQMMVEREMKLLQEAAAQDLRNQGYDSAPTLRQASEAWLKHRQSRGNGLSHNTVNEYKSVLKKHILPDLGDREIASITRSDVSEWRNGMEDKTGRGDEPLSARTINKTTVNFSGIFRSAMRPVDLGGFALPDNPFEWIELLPEDGPDELEPLTVVEVMAVARVLQAGKHHAPKRHAVGTRLKGRKTAVRAPTVNEAASMKRQDTYDAALVLTLAFCGIRTGEAAALRIKRVRFEEARLDVHRSYSGGAEGPTKGKERRSTVLPDQVAEPLAKLTLRPDHNAPDDLLFCNQDGGHMDMSAFRERFKKAVKLTGIERRVVPHHLRHGATTDLRTVFDADAVQRLIGHKDARTAQRYTHSRDQGDAASQWTDYLAAQIAAASGAE